MRKILPLFVVILIVFVLSYKAFSQNEKPAEPGPIKISVCQLLADPAAYNHKLIEVTGFISRGFEDSNLYDPRCQESKSVIGIWVEIGGKGGTGVMYCCGLTPYTTRPKDLIVEKIPIPLVDDDNYKQFTKVLTDSSGGISHVTAVGRFFSGEKVKYPGGTFWTGYGHMGCCSLFALQQVISVDEHNIPGIDYSSSGAGPDAEKEGCNNYTILETDSISQILEKQRKSDVENENWRVADPERVASEKLREFVKVSVSSEIKLEQVRESVGRRAYYWRPNGKRGSRYFVTVHRPYWLSFEAKDRKNTIWIVGSLYSLCDGSEQRIFRSTKVSKKKVKKRK